MNRKEPWVKKEFERETNEDPSFYPRLIITVWVPSFVGVVLTVTCFVLLLFTRDNALCQ